MIQPTWSCSDTFFSIELLCNDMKYNLEAIHNVVNKKESNKVIENSYS